jgi:hypothetical protein
MGVLARLLIAVALTACGGTQGTGPTILASMEPPPEGEQGQRSEEFTPRGPVSLRYRNPDRGGDAYRLTLEIVGERASRKGSDRREQDPVRESRVLELEYRELPLEGSQAQDDTSIMRLDGLHYIQMQQNPDAQREIELADDHLRLYQNGKKTVDIAGARAEGAVTPRKMLDRVFGVIVHDSTGNPIKVSRKGVPAVRRYLAKLPMLNAIAYAVIPRPEDPIKVGSRWTAVRFPVGRTGELGLRLNIEYSVAGFDVLDGVSCALIKLHAEERGAEVPSAAGFAFDRVNATLTGTAWIEVETSRLRRVVMDDAIRAIWTTGDGNAATTNRVRHESQLEIRLRDPADEPSHWADGTKRFGDR